LVKAEKAARNRAVSLSCFPNQALRMGNLTLPGFANFTTVIPLDRCKATTKYFYDWVDL
jgi:hypothetical protein